MHGLIWVLFAAALAYAEVAPAQTPATSVLPETKAVVQTERGNVHTCGVNYSVFVNDHIYKNGGYVMLVGSINMMYIKERTPFVTLKLQTADVLQTKSGQPQPQNFSPSYAYFFSRLGSSADKEIRTFECDGGGWCGAFTDMKTIEVAMDTVFGGSFSIAFTRPLGTTDVVAAIPGKDLPESADCMQRLLARYNE